jgi:hypothetical protein
MVFDRTVDSGPRGERGSFSPDLSPPFGDFLDSCTQKLLEISGKDSIISIVLGGSCALGECGLDRSSDKPRLVGDIDLLIVARSLEQQRRLFAIRDDLGSSCETSTDEIEFDGSVDVGVMQEPDFQSMGPSPFVYDLKNHGVVLFGDRGVLDLIPDFDSSEIGGLQALLLLQNRIVSFLGSFDSSNMDDTADRCRSLYGISKVYTDICTSILCLSGIYVPGYGARSERIRKASVENRLFLPVSGELIEAIERWTRFKLFPSAQLTDGDAAQQTIRRLWDGAARDALIWWKNCASRVMNGESGGGVDRDVEVLLDLSSSASARSNLRAWKDLVSGWPPKRRIGIVLGLRMGMLGGDPMKLVHEWGVRLLEHYVLEGASGSVQCPPAAYPHSGGSWEEAAREINSAWREILYGAKASKREE